MTRRALLLAIADYRRAPPIPYVAGDVTRLRRALVSAGWPDNEVQAYGAGSEPPETLFPLTTNEMKALIGNFLQNAKSDDDLLIYFSGHGVEMAGHRLLVPSDYIAEPPPQHYELISDTDLFASARKSDARSVLVLLDMCREEVAIRLSAPDKSLDLPEVQVMLSTSASAASPTVALVYSCARGERSGSDNTSYGCSAFTRAFAEALEDEKTPGQLGNIVAAAQEYLSRLRHQTITFDERHLAVGRAGEPKSILVKEDAAARLRILLQTSSWVTELPKTSGRLWTVLAEVPGLVPRLQTLVLRAEQMVADAQAVLSTQRWRDKDAPLRLLRRIDILLSHGEVPGQPLRSTPLTAAEAVMLIAVPFAYEAVLAAAERRLAADGRPVLNPLTAGPEGTHDPLWLAWRAAYESDDVIERQRSVLASRKCETMAEDVVAWRLTRFCHNVGELWDVQESIGARSGWAARDIAELSVPPPFGEACGGNHLQEILTARRLLRYARLMFAAFEDVELDATRQDEDKLRRDLKFGEAREQITLDEVKVVHLLNLGAKLALDARRLPPVAVEHLGSDEAFTLSEVLANLRRARWQSDGDTLTLQLDCAYQALDAAILEAVDELEAYRRCLQEAEGEAVAARCCLYVGFTAKRLRPVRQEGTRTFERPHLRFELERQRIMELLMGQQLYQNRPELALRELYQNALDACRYRRAQEEYRRRNALVQRALPPYAGRIDFRFGEDEDRYFVECQDNGIGMAEQHLRRLFARAGQRFTDSHEYHLDRARWEGASIPFFPNSRFGIGVLSYFMLAEELEIESQRVGPNGVHGTRGIRTHVLGSGSLFRLTAEMTGSVEGGGSRVRLYLKDRDADLYGLAQSVLEWLWLPEFMTTLQVYKDEQIELAQDTPTSMFEESVGPVIPIPESKGKRVGSRVFWCLSGNSSTWFNRTGIVLSDGILVSYNEDISARNRLSVADRTQSFPIFTAINLCEDLHANLSLDRLAVLSASDAASFARNMLSNYGWQQLSQWTMCDTRESYTQVISRMIEQHGLALDRFSFALFEGRVQSQVFPSTQITGASFNYQHLGICDLDAAIDKVVNGKASSHIEVERFGTVSHEGGRLLQIRMAQLTQAGYVTPPNIRIAAEFAALSGTPRFPAPTLYLLVSDEVFDSYSLSLEEFPEALGIAPALGLTRLVIASADWGASIGDLALLAQALKAFGLHVPDLTTLDCNAQLRFNRRHIMLISQRLDGAPPFDDVLSFGHVLQLILQEGPRSATEIVQAARELVALGINSTPILDRFLQSGCDMLTYDHIALLRQVKPNLFSGGWFRSADVDIARVTVPEVLAFAYNSGLLWPENRKILHDLIMLGFEVPDLRHMLQTGLAELQSEHVVLISVGLDGYGPFVPELTLKHLLRATLAMSLSLQEIAVRAQYLASLGVQTPNLTFLLDSPLHITQDHIDLLSSSSGMSCVTIADIVRIAAKPHVPLAKVVGLLREIVLLGVNAPGLNKLITEPIETIERMSQRHSSLGLSALFALLVPESDEDLVTLRPPHLVCFARDADVTLDATLDMVRDLATLGIPMPEVGAEVLVALRQLTERHLQLLDRGSGRQRPITELKLQYLLATAHRLGLQLDTVVQLGRDLIAAGMPVSGLENLEIVGSFELTDQHIFLLQKRTGRHFHYYGDYDESIDLRDFVISIRLWHQSFSGALTLVRDLASVGVPVTFSLPLSSERERTQNRLVAHIFVKGSACQLSCWEFALAADRLRVKIEDLYPEMEELAALGVDVGSCRELIQFARKRKLTVTELAGAMPGFG